MSRRLVANGIGRGRILREHVRLTAAAAEVLFLLGTARARLFHPAGAAKTVEPFGFVPDLADTVLADAREREARQHARGVARERDAIRRDRHEHFAPAVHAFFRA